MNPHAVQTEAELDLAEEVGHASLLCSKYKVNPGLERDGSAGKGFSPQVLHKSERELISQVVPSPAHI